MAGLVWNGMEPKQAWTILVKTLTFDSYIFEETKKKTKKRKGKNNAHSKASLKEEVGVKKNEGRKKQEEEKRASVRNNWKIVGVGEKEEWNNKKTGKREYY